MKRFLQYALEREKKLRMVYLLNGVPKQTTAAVLAYDEEKVCLKPGRGKPVTIPLSDVLACDYARGDQGED